MMKNYQFHLAILGCTFLLVMYNVVYSFRAIAPNEYTKPLRSAQRQPQEQAVADARKKEPSASHQQAANATTENKIEKSIPIGGHANLPGPSSRIGPNGEKGYVHDPTFLHKHPKPFQILKSERDFICAPPGRGCESPRGAKVLNHIRNHMESIPKAVSDGQSNASNKVFCAVYTYDGAVERTEAVSQTWGKRCDGLLFASSISNTTTGHVHLPSMSDRGFLYDGIGQRVRAILAYLYDYFLEDYDYFHIVGDDVYLLIENLKEFLASSKVQEWEQVPDQYFFGGFWSQGPMVHMPEGEFYLGGGSGYTISKKALKAYVEGPLEVCDPYWEGAMEDVHLGKCIFKHITRTFLDTRDEVGAHRYHQMPVWAHVNHPIPHKRWYWLKDSKQAEYEPRNANVLAGEKYHYSWRYMKPIINSLEHMYHNFSFPFVQQEEYISNSSIAFHRHDNGAYLKRYEMLLYRDGVAECGDLWHRTDNSNTSLDQLIIPIPGQNKGCNFCKRFVYQKSFVSSSAKCIEECENLSPRQYKSFRDFLENFNYTQSIGPLGPCMKLCEMAEKRKIPGSRQYKICQEAKFCY